MSEPDALDVEVYDRANGHLHEVIPLTDAAERLAKLFEVSNTDDITQILRAGGTLRTSGFLYRLADHPAEK